MSKEKILFVLSSHKELGDTGNETGYYLSEVSHPWEILTDAGYEIEFVSPQGGNPPVDGFDLEDPVNKAFWEDVDYKEKRKNTMKPSEVNPEEYAAVHYAGGHGTMWDFPENEKLAGIGAAVYENGGVVSAVCHGPAGLVNLKLSNGEYLVDGKKTAAFTDAEEKEMGLEEVVPFMLESTLRDRGADIQAADNWEENAVTDQRLVTGQNPQSAKAVGRHIAETLN